MKNSNAKAHHVVVNEIKTSKPLIIASSIDKVILRFDRPITTETLKEYLDTKGYQYKYSKLKNENALLVEDHFYFVFQLNSINYISKIIVNPNRFSTYTLFKRTYNKVLDEEILSDTYLLRVDFACDFYNKSFEWLSPRLVVKDKRLVERYVEKSSTEGSRYFGTGNEVINHYPKQPDDEEIVGSEEEETEPFRYSRLEVRRKGSKKLPFHTLDELEKALIEGTFNPFQKVLVQDFKVLRPKSSSRKSIHIRYGVLIRILPILGYTYTQKKLNKNRNWSRDYKPFLKAKSETCIGDYFLRSIEIYFSEEDVL